MTDPPHLNPLQLKPIIMAEEDNNLYKVISNKREHNNHPFARLLYCGYFNEMALQREKIQIELFLTEQTKPFKTINGYLYLKGLFYLHLLEAEDPAEINKYMALVLEKHKKQPNTHHNINIIYQSFENSERYFKNWICENIFQTGPTLNESDKGQQQIQQRAYEIYSKLCEGAKKKQSDSSTKIANECPLNMDDMCMMINNTFMTIEQFGEIYLSQFQVTPDSEEQFPLRPSVLQYMEFLEIDNYKDYRN